MPTQTEKIQAECEHLLDGFLALRERWALLSPMLRDRTVHAGFGSGRRSRGFESLRRSLAFACAVDAANLCYDHYDRTPSLLKVVGVLKDAHLVAQFRRTYSSTAFFPLDEHSTYEGLAAAMKEANKQRRKQRAADFDDKLQQLLARVEQLSVDPSMLKLKTVRDRVAAHAELEFVDGKYLPVTLASLGLKPRHFEEAIEGLRNAISLAQLVCRSAGFAWDSFERQVDAVAKSYWAPNGDG